MKKKYTEARARREENRINTFRFFNLDDLQPVFPFPEKIIVKNDLALNPESQRQLYGQEKGNVLKNRIGLQGSSVCKQVSGKREQEEQENILSKASFFKPDEGVSKCTEQQEGCCPETI